jgi:hypothetical protein
MSLIPDDLLNRAAINQMEKYKYLDGIVTSWRKRQVILAGEPDSLSDNDLFNHYYENRLRRVVKAVLVIGLPAGYFYYRRHIIQTIFLTIFSFSFCKFLNTFNIIKSDYSMQYAQEIRKNNLALYYSYNGSYLVTPDIFWQQRSLINSRDDYLMKTGQRTLPKDLTPNMQPI